MAQDPERPRPGPPLERPPDPTDLVARVRARLAEHEADPHGRAARAARLRELAVGWWPSSRRHQVEIGVGGGALVLALAAAVVAIRFQGDTAPPAPQLSRVATSVGGPARAVAGLTASDLEQRLPASWRSRCRPIRAAARAPSALACAPVAGVVVEVQRVAADALVASLRRLAPTPARSPGKLPCTRRGPPTWSLPAHPERAVGHVMCFTSARGAQLVWSIDRDALVMHATRADGDLRQLFSWWVVSTF